MASNYRNNTNIRTGLGSAARLFSPQGSFQPITCSISANHAFNNDTRAVRYNKAAAELAWKRTIAFFRKTLEG